MKLQLNALLIVFALVNLFTINNVKAQTTTPQTYSVEQMIEKAPTLVGQTVQVQGRVSHVCKTTGRKLFLETADESKTFRINAGKNITKYSQLLIDSIVVATGVVAETRITLDDLKKQEAKAIEAEKTKKAAEHCTSEAKANGENTQATPLQRIQVQIEKINKQVAEGKNSYLSFYTVDDCNTYKTIKE